MLLLFVMFITCCLDLFCNVGLGNGLAGVGWVGFWFYVCDCCVGLVGFEWFGAWLVFWLFVCLFLVLMIFIVYYNCLF